MRGKPIIWRVLLLCSMALAVPSALADDVSMVRLAGTPKQIGRTWGALNKDTIACDMDATFLRPAAKAGISRETLIERSVTFVQIVETIAPHWLEEAAEIARTAGVDEDLYIAFFDGQARNRFLHQDTAADAHSGAHVPDNALIECTSYAVSRDHARGRAILFHKTRDNIDRPQMGVVVDSALANVNKFITVTDGSRIRCSMMVNDKGLAGSGDYPAERKKDSSTLYLEPAEPQYRGLMAGSILRYVAERAASSAEALAIIEDVVAKGYYAGGEVNASHWLFVDREGTILEVCNNARHVLSKVHTQKVYFSRLNKSAAAKRLRESSEPIGFLLFHTVSRDPSICFDSSISGMTVEIDPEHPEVLTCTWIALPVRAPAFPLLMGQRCTPAVLADGRAYALGRDSQRPMPQWEAAEQAMHDAKQQLIEHLRNDMIAGNPSQAQVEFLEEWSRDQAARLLNALEQPESRGAAGSSM